MSIYVSVMNLHSFMQKMFFCCISDTVCWSSVCFLQWLIDRNPGTFLSKSHLLLPLVTTCNFILTVTEAGLSYNRLWINYLHGCDSELPCRRDKGGIDCVSTVIMGEKQRVLSEQRLRTSQISTTVILLPLVYSYSPPAPPIPLSLPCFCFSASWSFHFFATFFCSLSNHLHSSIYLLIFYLSSSYTSNKIFCIKALTGWAKWGSVQLVLRVLISLK